MGVNKAQTRRERNATDEEKKAQKVHAGRYPWLVPRRSSRVSPCIYARADMAPGCFRTLGPEGRRIGPTGVELNPTQSVHGLNQTSRVEGFSRLSIVQGPGHAERSGHGSDKPKNVTVYQVARKAEGFPCSTRLSEV